MPTPREAYTNSVQRESRTGARLRAADFGSAGETIGRAMQGLGQDLGKVADNMAEAQKRDAETAAQEADNIRLAKRLKRFYEGPEGFFNQEGRNAVAGQDQLQKDLEAIDRESGELLAKKPFARALYDKATARRNADDMPRIFQHVNVQRNKYEDQVDADAFDLAIDNATSASDPVIIEANIATVMGIAEKKARRSGMFDDNGISQAKQQAAGKAIAAIAQKLEMQSPGEAQQFVTTHAHLMDPNEVGALLNTLQGGAAEERAGSKISQYIVPVGGAAPAGGPPAAGGSSPPAAGAGRTMMPPEAALAAAQWAQESGGRHTNADGSFVTSGAGARGVSQVMPKTGVDPGYGIKPLQNNSREEFIRFGNDYRNAMLKEYRGNITLALTAYNWGPGNLNAHIKKVGDPSKGQISDAAFLASIPVKEAREYAPSVLNRVGVSVAGAPGPSAGRPVQVGQEIDIVATVNAIRNSDLPWIDKKALIAEATRLHGYGKQAKAETEAATVDAVYAHINTLPPNGFTDYNKLPLSLRQQLDRNPQAAVRFKAEAASNLAAKQGAADTEANTQQRLDLADLRFGRPDEFIKIDPRTDPRTSHLTTAQKLDLVAQIEAEKKSRANPGSDKSVDHDRVRAAVNRLAGPEKDRPKNLGQGYDEAVRRVEALVAAGKPVNDAVVDGIAREVMTKYTVHVKGTFYGDSEGSTVRGYELPAEKARLGSRYSRATVNSYDAVRSQLQQIWKRVPTDAEVQAEIQTRTTSAGALRL